MHAFRPAGERASDWVRQDMRDWHGTSALAVTGALLLMGLAFTGCDRPEARNDGKQQAAPIATVSVSRPIVEEIIEWDEYTGRFDAVDTVDVRARVSGYLDQIAFKDGQMVQKGDLLFVIDPRPFERVRDQARAELAQAQTRADNLVADVERGKPLLERRIMSEKMYEDRANLLREAQAAVKVAEAKVAAAELELSFTRMTAPLAGRTSRATTSQGNWVSAGSLSNTTVLTTIVSQDPIHIYFDVSENNYIKYKRLAERGETRSAASPGANVEIALPDETSFNHKGRLDFIDNRLDAGTATLRVRAEIENKAQLFSPGMFARVRLAGSGKAPAILLPDEAIATDQGSKYVLVVAEDGSVSRKTVRLGPLSGGLRVVRDGMAANDWVVVKGLQLARPGQKVQTKREAIRVSQSADSAPRSDR
ncbi:MAG TPA: efflux RND transporter periplasmic adaptor subunit [Hyphomicrobiaceae bacterium]